MYDRRPDFFREDAPPGRQVDATVKWFNASKGFGFVTMADGSQDAFLPMAILRRAGYEDVREGASITCEVGAGAKGPLVKTEKEVKDTMIAVTIKMENGQPVTRVEGKEVSGDQMRLSVEGLGEQTQRLVPYPD